MGDPETQPIMMRLKSDLVEVLLAATDGKLDQVELQWDRRTALGVVMAAAATPKPAQGRRHHRPAADADDAMVFHAGTELDGRPGAHQRRPRAVRDGAGRQRQAGAAAAYDVARGIHFDGAQYRRDIGFRAVKN
jgi:phosphoribosylamine--glycine ligase